MSAFHFVYEVNVVYQGHEAAARLFVVKREGPSLLSRDILKKVRLNWEEVKHMSD